MEPVESGDIRKVAPWNGLLGISSEPSEGQVDRKKAWREGGSEVIHVGKALLAQEGGTAAHWIS